MRRSTIFLLLIACTVFGTGLLANDIRYRGADTLLEVRKAKFAPVIDGVMDPIWRSVSETWMTSFGNGTSLPDDKADLYGSFKLMWDDNYIYGLLTTYDDVLFNGMTNSYENDSWEIYFDADNSKGTSYDGVNDCQLRFEWQKDVDGSGVDGTAPAALLADVQAGIELAQLDFDAGNGYMIEFAIPLEAIQLDAAAGTKFGLELQQNDNDGTARDHISKWWLQSGDASWNNASVFGTAVLLGEIVTGVGQKPVAELKNYTLGQNYPNPFNPTTKITYSVAKTEKVKLAVYNLLGMQVAKLVDGVKSAGAYTVEFNARNLPSGVYFYKLETANQQLSKKMVFLK
jgi:hypothetical protein